MSQRQVAKGTPSQTFHLAQVNVARVRAPLDSPTMREFTAALDPINRLAEQSPGFVWRLAGGHGSPTAPALEEDPRAFVNVSVWLSYEALHAYVYRSPHGRYVRERGRWFVPSRPPSTALWWVPAGQHPTLPDALRHLEYLRRYGPTPRAFTMRRRFHPDGRVEVP